MAGSSNMTSMMMMMMMCMCMASCMMSMMGMGPFGGLFSGASSLIGGAGGLVGGAGDLVGGAGKGAGKGLSALGRAFSGEYEHDLDKIHDFKSVACQECAAQNWTGSIISFKKEVPCSALKPKC